MTPRHSTRSTVRRIGGLASVLTVTAALAATAATGATVPPSSYADLHWRLVGPFRAGWATAVAGVPGDAATWYFGSADGGVWRTTNAGGSWLSLWDGDGKGGTRPTTSSIGALAVAPSDPRVLWVGTGQIHARWDIVSGDGVYRSTDAGTTWSHVGLADSAHIGAIWVDPRDAGVAVVAALGHVFGSNDERGLFRTADGGRTWEKVLFRDADTGGCDLAGDPATPDILYASLWQVRSHPWLDYFQPPVGPGSSIWRSRDAGRTWEPTGTKGLPATGVGRIELAVAPGTAGQRVWASIDATDGNGVYRSEDGGGTWERTAEDLAGSYMSGLIVDPKSPETVWAMGRSLRRSTDGGRTFPIVKGAPGGDDYHTLWIDPTDPRRMITGADQGAVVTLDGGATWSSWYNQPTGQFYRLATDDAFPYRIYSGQQDSGTVRIASRSDYGQITFRDWMPTGGDERDGDIPDPRDPGIVYGAGLGGRVSKWNERTAQVQNVAPWPIGSYGQRPGTSPFRFDWITPLAISKRPPHAIWTASQLVWRSLDGGASWQTVSGDLTGASDSAGNAGLDCSGDVPVERATACGYGAVFAIAPSPAADGVVWVGTTNGRVQLTRDDGATWNDVTPPGLLDWSKVNIIDASPSDPATAYVAADRHRLDDLRPIVWRTHDYGATWSEIGGGLPASGWVGAVRQDPQVPTLLYAGTSRGVHVSFDDGGSWQDLAHGLPQTGINDLLVHGDDVIVATQGRALWVLDQVAPLRALARDAAASPGATAATAPVLVPPPAAVRLRPNQNRDTPLPPEEPNGDNPPVGAVLDYVLPAATSGPVVIEIRDDGGRLVRRLASDDTTPQPKVEVYYAELWRGQPARPATGPGHHRFVWNLRWPRPAVRAAETSMAALPGRETPLQPQGALVLPGRYRVLLVADGTSVAQPLEVVADPRSTASAADLAALLAFQREVETTLAEAVPLAASVEHATQRLATLRTAASGRQDRHLDALAQALATATGGRNDRAETIVDVLTALAIDLESADTVPTAPQRDTLAQERETLATALARWRAFEASRDGAQLR